ncbi:MAG: NAD(P)H-dependent amine dehydrogenase family protein [Woeseiaceae bacterium]
MSYRVIQWSTGAIGKTCLRQVIDHPDLELAGLLVYSESKAGRDAGDIARRDSTGVLATQSADEILALDADVVLHLPLNLAETFDQHDEDIKRLLRSGKNVITTVRHGYPWAAGPDYAAGFEDACREGNATLFGTGINPGFMTERLATTLTTVCTNVEHILTREIYDFSQVLSPGFIFDHAGIGLAPKVFAESRDMQQVFEHIFAEVVGVVGHTLKVDFDEVVRDHEFGVAEHDLQLPAGEVKAGGVVNCRWRWHGMKDGKPFLTIEMVWLVDPTLEGWEYEDGWDIEITGAPGIRARIDLVEPENMPDRSKAMQYAVAGPVIRAIPDVVNAAPGILLPPSFAAFSPRM